jgi:hypothetical protein
MSIQFNQSPVFFSDKSGEEFNFSGINFKVAAVASPLVEDGSGQGLGHPETDHKKAQKSSVSLTLSAIRGDEEEIMKKLWVAGKKTKLAPGDTVIKFQNGIGSETVKWDKVLPGKVVAEPIVRFNALNRTLDIRVECVEIESSDAEKYRGFGKYRSNGGFLTSVKVHNPTTGQVLFNPNTALKNAAGEIIQAEHVVGGEEYKTLSFIIGIVARKMEAGKAVWDSTTGKWSNEAKLMALVESEAQKVTVERSNYEESVYQMFKAMYGTHADFSFDDSTNSITHTNVWAWYGDQVEIVEVPLTKTFVGKCPLFAEHIHYIGTEFPELYKLLLSEVQKNQALVNNALAIALGDIPGATDDNPYGTCAVIDGETIVVEGEKISIKITEVEGGTSVVDEITIPENQEFNLAFFRKLHKLLLKNGFTGVVVESFDKDGEANSVPLSLDVFTLVTGTVSQNAFVTLARLFVELETEVDQRSYDNWEGNFYRLCRMLQGSLEFIVADSNSLIAKATKTPSIAFTCRAGTTVDASVALDEIHIHSEMLAYWNIDQGDLFVVGRVPVPGLGVLKVVANDKVPFGTAVMSAATKHAVEEGDSDGDSLIGIVISPEGVLKTPGSNIQGVNPLAGQ